MAASLLKPVIWIGSSRRDLCELSYDVQSAVGFALYFAQQGKVHTSAKVLKGFGGAGIWEIIANDKGGTYRAVYAVKFADVLYVLHVFQKKSTKGITTPEHEIELIKKRLRLAEAHYREHEHGQ